MAVSAQAEIPSQFGRSAVVTGATGGLGYETALALARAGAEVILTGRDDRKGQSAIEKISREVSGAGVSYQRLDLANFASIADFSQRMHSRQSLDLLINNAGVMALPRKAQIGQRCLPRGFALAREGKQGVSRRSGRRYRFFVIVEHRINRRAASGARIEDYILHAATACVEKSHRPGVRG